MQQTKNKSPQELLEWLNCNGYPFAQIQLDTVTFHQDKTEFVWDVYAGKFITLDSLQLKDNLFNRRVLQRCINYRIGQPFSLNKIKNIQNSLNQISFIQPNPKVLTQLYSESFGLNIQPIRKKNNTISALVALQPKPNSNQSILTGNIDLELFNALKQAETIQFHWKRPQPQSQNLAFVLGSPYTLGLPVGFQFEFNSFLRDSTFSSTDLTLRLLTKISEANGFSAAIVKSTNNNFRSSQSFGNTQSKSYSVRYARTYNKANSVSFFLESSAGNRIIQYSTTQSSKKSFSVKGRVWSSIQLSHLFFARLNLEATRISSDSLFYNEMPRLGGTKNLRGFIEESIYASQYAMFNCDWGVALGSDAQAFVFADLASVVAPMYSLLYDTGIGLRFQQENGSVGITYGVGNTENNGLQIKNGRVGITFSSSF